MTKKQLALRVTLPLLVIIALVALIWQPAAVWFRLYQLRGDEAHAQAAMEPIIELGADMQAPLIDAVHAHAPEPDVGYFRPAAFEILARLRRERVVEHRNEGILIVQPDEEAIDALVLAYENEPSAAYRQVMREALSGVDAWTFILFWGRSRGTPYPLEGVPYGYAGGFGPNPCGEPHVFGDPLLPEVQTVWCEHVGTVVSRWLAEGSEPYVIDRPRLARLLDRRCAGEGSFAALGARAPDLNGSELNDVLNHAFTRHDRQEDVLSALIRPDAECNWQRRLHRALEIRRPLVGEAPELLRGWVSAMNDDCLAELFEETEPGARRDRMRRSLGVTRDVVE
ncbi:MAG: hypothetical protein AB8H86_28150 [Polyangiales bacterium]